MNKKTERKQENDDGWFFYGGRIILIIYVITLVQCKPDCFVLVLLLHYNIKAYNQDNNRNYYNYIRNKEGHALFSTQKDLSVNPAPSDGVDQSFLLLLSFSSTATDTLPVLHSPTSPLPCPLLSGFLIKFTYYLFFIFFSLLL